MNEKMILKEKWKKLHACIWMTMIHELLRWKRSLKKLLRRPPNSSNLRDYCIFCETCCEACLNIHFQVVSCYTQIFCWHLVVPSNITCVYQKYVMFNFCNGPDHGVLTNLHQMFKHITNGRGYEHVSTCQLSTAVCG